MQTITIETVLLKDLVTMCLTAILNTPYDKTLIILKGVDQRSINFVSTERDLSYQVLSAYDLYKKYLPILDPEYYQIRKEYFQ